MATSWAELSTSATANWLPVDHTKYRFYLPSDGEPPFAFSAFSGWDNTASLVRRVASLAPGLSGLVTKTVVLVGIGLIDVVFYQYIVGPLVRHVLRGTIRAQLLGFINTAVPDYFPDFVARIVSADGLQERGILSSNLGSSEGKTAFSSSTKNRVFINRPMDEVSVQNGDYLVFEIGCFGPGSARLMKLQTGYQAQADLPEDELAVSGNSWVEIDGILQLQVTAWSSIE